MPVESPVLLDACVLAPFRVCDLFLRLAEEPRLYSPRWSSAILDQVRRTQVGKLGWPEALADYWRREVEASFPEALVSDYDHLVPRCRNHPEDRHVLAAARMARVSAIVTFNLVHFPHHALAPHGMVAVHPADYLCRLYDMEPALVVARLSDIAQVRGIEPIDVLRRLHGPLLRFTNLVARSLGWQL